MAKLHPTLFHGVHRDEVARWIIDEFDDGYTILGNDGVSDTVWLENYPAKPLPDVEVAMYLVGPLTPERVAHIVATETRAKPLAEVLKHWTLNDEDLATLMAGKGLSKSIAKKLYDQPKRLLSNEVQDRLARKAGGTALLNWYAYGPTVDYDEIFDAMSSFETFKVGKTGKSYRDEMSGILNRYPQLVNELANSGDLDPRLHNVVYGSRHFTDEAAQVRAATFDSSKHNFDEWGWGLLALVNNPVVGEAVFDQVHESILAANTPSGELVYKLRDSIRKRRETGRTQVTVPYEQVDNPAIIAWLIGRARPFMPDYGASSPGRPWDAAALTANLNLNTEQANRLAAGLDSPFAIEQLGELWVPTVEAFLERHPVTDGCPGLWGLSVTLDEERNPRPYIEPEAAPRRTVNTPSDEFILGRPAGSLTNGAARRAIELAYDAFGTNLSKWGTFNAFLYDMPNQTLANVISLAQRL